MKGLPSTSLTSAGSRALGGWIDPRLSFRRVDWPLFAVAAALLSIGLVFVGAMAEADQLYSRQDVSFAGHLKKVAVSLPLLFAAFLVRPRFLRRHAGWVYAGCIVLLALVPLIGDVRNNARRWIQLPLGFDVAAVGARQAGAHPALAHLLYRRRMRELEDWFAPVVATLLPMLMVAAQPDLGTAMTIVPVALGMFYLAGARGRVVALIVLAMAALGWATWRYELVQDYQLKRIDVWAETFAAEDLVEAKRRGAFHAYQARLAIGNGGFGGQGLGRGIANRSGYLPERDCDSIFAVVAEEGGFLGATALIGLYLLLVLLLLFASARIRERFARLAVGGIGLYFASHFFINVALNLGLLPMTGLTLPLLSTGGSSMMASFCAIGLALGLSARHEPTLDEDAFRL